MKISENKSGIVSTSNYPASHPELISVALQSAQLTSKNRLVQQKKCGVVNYFVEIQTENFKESDIYIHQL